MSARLRPHGSGSRVISVYTCGPWQRKSLIFRSHRKVSVGSMRVSNTPCRLPQLRIKRSMETIAVRKSTFCRISMNPMIIGVGRQIVRLPSCILRIMKASVNISLSWASSVASISSPRNSCSSTSWSNPCAWSCSVCSACEANRSHS